MFDEDARATVSKLAQSFEIRNRLKRTVCFRDYLEERWHAANIEATYYSFTALCEQQRESFDKVESAVRALTSKPKPKGRVQPWRRGRA